MDQLEEIRKRLDTLEHGHQLLLTQNNNIRKSLDDNTASTNKISENTEALVDLFRTAKAGAGLIIKLLGIAKWLGGIATSLAALWVIWYAITHGQVPGVFTKLPSP